MKPGLFSLLGFIIGAGLGFAWAQGVKKALPGRVTSTMSGGIVTVKVDAKGAAIDGLSTLLNR